MTNNDLDSRPDGSISNLCLISECSEICIRFRDTFSSSRQRETKFDRQKQFQFFWRFLRQSKTTVKRTQIPDFWVSSWDRQYELQMMMIKTGDEIWLSKKKRARRLNDRTNDSDSHRQADRNRQRGHERKDASKNVFANQQHSISLLLQASINASSGTADLLTLACLVRLCSLPPTRCLPKYLAIERQSDAATHSMVRCRQCHSESRRSVLNRGADIWQHGRPCTLASTERGSLELKPSHLSPFTAKEAHRLICILSAKALEGVPGVW